MPGFVSYPVNWSTVLVKFCRSEHNVLSNGARLRIGTLQEFRDTENQSLKDEGEGTFRVVINFAQPTWIGFDWFRAVAKIGYEEGPPKIPYVEGTVVSELQLLEVDRPRRRVLVVGSVLIYEVDSNAMVLCLSTQVRGTLTNPFDEYDSAWAIRPEHRGFFFSHLRKLLESKVRKEDWFQEGIGFFSKSSPVGYGQRYFAATNEQDVPIDFIRYVAENCDLIKPIQFFTENEYRFILRLTGMPTVVSEQIFPRFVEGLTLRPLLFDPLDQCV